MFRIIEISAFITVGMFFIWNILSLINDNYQVRSYIREWTNDLSNPIEYIHCIMYMYSIKRATVHGTIRGWCVPLVLHK